MLNTDSMASATITYLNALAANGRLKPLDQQTLTAHATKLGSAPTSRRQDQQVVGIIDRFYAKIKY